MELREKIARICFDIGKDEMSACDAMADAILALPEIRDALEMRARVRVGPERTYRFGRPED